MKPLSLFALFFLPLFLSSQNCDCSSNFAWLKKTFEENDAGFQYALGKKGEDAYKTHNKRIAEKAKAAQTLTDCRDVLDEWLKFFRSGHIGIGLIPTPGEQAGNGTAQNAFSDWETFSIDTDDFKAYLDQKEAPDLEGIWTTGPYVIGVKREGEEYIGFIVESEAETWSRGQVKIRFRRSEDAASGVFYMYDHSPAEFQRVDLLAGTQLQLGRFNLSRQYPQLPVDPAVEAYVKSLDASLPYLDQLNETTLYLRIPSFQSNQKRAIDSVLEANRERILSTESLIIDIRNGTGGSDSSYKGLIPFLYTNPIREVGVELLSTELNNQRMLDFINKPEYGFDEEGKKWAQESFDKLSGQEGTFVNLNENEVNIIQYDTVYAYPKNVGILINEGNGSTDEQFLLAAKQSKKVKLFGTSTHGVLDVSNMYFVNSPCDEFQLGYSLSRSMRIPDFTIDGHGIQPDFYMDKGIPVYEWVEYAAGILTQGR